MSTSAFHLQDQSSSYLHEFCFSGPRRCRLPPLPLRPRRSPFFQGNLTQSTQINAKRDAELQDDIIDIIAMNASGLWRGACAGRVGNFKFVPFFLLFQSFAKNFEKF